MEIKCGKMLLIMRNTFVFNLQFQIISLVFVLMVLVLFCVRKKLHITRERVFLGVVVTCMASCVMDIMCIAGMDGSLALTPAVMNLIRRIYLITVVGVGLWLVLYTLAEVYRMAIMEPLVRRLYVLPLAVSVPLILRLPLETRRSGATYFGPAVYVSAAVTFIYLTIALLYALKMGNRMNPGRRNAIFLAMGVMTGCGIFQLYNQEISVMSLAVSIVLTYMYMVLESPDVYLDKTYDVFNKDAFHMYLDNMCREKHPVSVLFVTVNEFTNMTEIAGTVITSELLRQAANYLKTFKAGRLFSIGTGEFILTFEKEEHFFEYAQQIRDRFEDVWNIDESHAKNLVEFEIGVSIIAYGSMRMPGDSTCEDIINTIRYFEQKYAHSGRSYICIDRRQLWEMEAVDHVNSEIEGAVAENRIDVYYQPIFSVYENNCSEIEALIRVRDRRNIYFDNSLIMPAAEASGEITELGYAAFRQVCDFAAHNDLKRAGITKIAVNLSMVQCQQRTLAEGLIAIMEEYGVSASLFRFEISENTAEYMTQNLRRNMNSLIAQGSSFVIDNYGSRRIDADKVTQISRDYIKLGEGVIRSYFDGDKSKQSMRVLCRMLLQLKMTVAAVGVENQREYTELKNLGITHMQGNAFYRPMPPDQVLELLEKERALMLGKENQFERAI